MRRQDSGPGKLPWHLLAGFLATQIALWSASGSTAAQVVDDLLVRTNDGKQPLGKVVRARRQNEDLQKYRKLRIGHGASPLGQAELARWCRKHGLQDQAALHWRLVLAVQPENPDAMAALGLRRFRGELLTKEAIDKARATEDRQKQANKRWLPRLRTLQAAIANGDATERADAVRQLREIRDPLAIPALLKVFALEDATIQLHVVETLVQMPHEAATDALVRFALESPDVYLREQAAEALASRSDRSYLSKLVGRLAAPIELKSNLTLVPGKAVLQPYEGITQTGRIVPGLFNVVRLQSEYTKRDVMFWGPEVRPFSGTLYAGTKPNRLRYQYVLTRESPDPDQPYEYVGYFEVQQGAGANGRGARSVDRFAARMAEDVKKTNQSAAEMNRRIDQALRLSGTDAAKPKVAAPVESEVDIRGWWDWWQADTAPNNYLAEGMSVWTETGSAQIEKILVGDRVLARDFTSGELVLALVIGMDRQPKPRAQVFKVKNRTVVATPEQRFHVADEGWRPASELAAGSELTTLFGKCTVTNVESSEGENVMYSLLLDQGANYFVDVEGILVHDATGVESGKAAP